MTNGYQCNCGLVFNSPEERTIHALRCPKKTDQQAAQELKAVWVKTIKSYGLHSHLYFAEEVTSETIMEICGKLLDLAKEAGYQYVPPGYCIAPIQTGSKAAPNVETLPYPPPGSQF